MTTKPVAGHCSISRVDRSLGRAQYRIRIEDKTSGIQFVEVTMTAEQFAGALTSMPCECALEFRALDTVGKVHESKTVAVPYPDNFADFNVWWKENVDPLEVDGWMAGRDGAENRFNFHRLSEHKKKGEKKAERTYAVHFYRFVDGPPKEACPECCRTVGSHTLSCPKCSDYVPEPEEEGDQT
jgi:hypothetical protein